LSLKCLPGDIDSFWEEMLQRASPGAALLSARMAAQSTLDSTANANTPTACHLAPAQPSRSPTPALCRRS
jgi:hypothetical protein